MTFDKAGVNYRYDIVAKTISPLAPGQRWKHRELGLEAVIFAIQEGSFPHFPDKKLLVEYHEDTCDHGLANPYHWDDQAHFFEHMSFVGWEYDHPPKIDMSRFPHVCPRCAQPAYVGACGGGDVDCTNPDCPTRKR